MALLNRSSSKSTRRSISSSPCKYSVLSVHGTNPLSSLHGFLPWLKTHRRFNTFSVKIKLKKKINYADTFNDKFHPKSFKQKWEVECGHGAATFGQSTSPAILNGRLNFSVCHIWYFRRYKVDKHQSFPVLKDGCHDFASSKTFSVLAKLSVQLSSPLYQWISTDRPYFLHIVAKTDWAHPTHYDFLWIVVPHLWTCWTMFFNNATQHGFRTWR